MEVKKIVVTTYDATMTEEEYKAVIDALSEKVNAGTATPAQVSVLNSFQSNL